MNAEQDEEPAKPETTPRSLFWSRLTILLIGGAALGLLVLMCVVVVAIAYLRG